MSESDRSPLESSGAVDLPWDKHPTLPGFPAAEIERVKRMLEPAEPFKDHNHIHLDLDSNPWRVEPLLDDEEVPAWAPLEARHRTILEGWEERESRSRWWNRVGWGVFLLFCVLAVAGFFTILYVISNWPESAY